MLRTNGRSSRDESFCHSSSSMYLHLLMRENSFHVFYVSLVLYPIPTNSAEVSISTVVSFWLGPLTAANIH